MAGQKSILIISVGKSLNASKIFIFEAFPSVSKTRTWTNRLSLVKCKKASQI